MREYIVNGNTYQLDEADAERLGGVPVQIETKAVQPVNKGRKPVGKGQNSGDTRTVTGRRPTAADPDSDRV